MFNSLAIALSFIKLVLMIDCSKSEVDCRPVKTGFLSLYEETLLPVDANKVLSAFKDKLVPNATKVKCVLNLARQSPSEARVDNRVMRLVWVFGNGEALMIDKTGAGKFGRYSFKLSAKDLDYVDTLMTAKQKLSSTSQERH